VAVDLDFLRRVVLHPHTAAVDERLEVDPDAVGVADDLPHRFVQRQHQAALATTGPYGLSLGIVTRDKGLLAANHYLAVAIDYLFRHRPQWPAHAAVGKTVVSTRMIDLVAQRLGRTLYEVPVGADLGGFYASAGRDTLYVIEGSLLVRLATDGDGSGSGVGGWDGEVGAALEHRLDAGDSIVYSTEVAHQWVQAGHRPTSFLHVQLGPGTTTD